MVPAELIPILLFVCITAGVIALASLVIPSRDRVVERVRSLSGTDPRKVEVGPVGRLIRRTLARVVSPLDAQRQDQLGLRLMHAGYDAPHVALVFRAVRLSLIVGPLAVAAVVLVAGALSLKTCAIAGAILSALGLVAPGMWLDSRKKSHQNELRRGLPDFFDVLVLCVEGGMSLSAAWRRVADELRRAYPSLWKELKLVEQEAEIGRPMNEAIQRCAERTGLDELMSLASVVRQAERLGTELALPMRNLSDTLRLQRVQRAEETAHKTATLIMFPTLLFIFPGVFGVLLGPMIVQVMKIFSGGKQ
jgi:tight adherence protein C